MPLPLTLPFRAYTSFIYHMRTCFNKVRPVISRFSGLIVVAMVDIYFVCLLTSGRRCQELQASGY